MLKTMIKRNRDRKRIRFNLNKTNCCPECRSKIFWDNKKEIYRCSNEDCSYMATITGSRIWDTSTINKSLENEENIK